jgi:hypothetical protein
MAKQVQEKAGLIAQAQAEYEVIVEEVRGYCQKAREWTSVNRLDTWNRENYATKSYICSH